MPGERSSLYRKQVLALAGAVLLPLSIYAAFNAWQDYLALRLALAQLYRGQAQLAAVRVDAFIRELGGQVRWATHLPWTEEAERQKRLDALRVLKEAPAVTDLALIDQAGIERVRVSRLALNHFGPGPDRSAETAFRRALSEGIYHGPVVFRRETEPYMVLGIAGSQRSHGVAIADVNLKHVWEIVSGLRIGHEGLAYVVDGGGRLIAHPDISLVLRNTDMTGYLASVGGDARSGVMRAINRDNVPVLMTEAEVGVPGWRVVVEVPEAEANELLKRAGLRAFWFAIASLLLAIGLALLLARKMVRPIVMLTAGAARIGDGDLAHRLNIRTGDEIETLASSFNAMAAELEASHAELEHRIEERTLALANANRAMSHFLAAASHDLRQPLHALNLLVARLPHEDDEDRRRTLATNIESAVVGINGLIDNLMDLSRLDTGQIKPHPIAHPVSQVLGRIETVFAAEAKRLGLRLRVRPSRQWICSDPVLLERVVANLVANALRYTPHGCVVVACRTRGDLVRIDVLDSGIGIAPDRQTEIFKEFYRGHADETTGASGLGIGLAIVDGLCRLLGHPLSVRSALGCGSRFSVSIPRAPGVAAGPTDNLPRHVSLGGRRIWLVDDDAVVLAGTREMLQSWGCTVLAATDGESLSQLPGPAPDLLICDYHLGGGEDAVATIALLRRRFAIALPAFVVSADVTPEVANRVSEAGLPLLRKPASPMALRATVSRVLASQAQPTSDGD